MIRREAERSRGRLENFKDGVGHVLTHTLIAGPEDIWGKGRVLTHNTLERDCEIGWHIHQGDAEVFYILRGEGEYNDNGTSVTVSAGDVTFCADGEGHSLINRGDEPLELIALVLYT